MKNIFLLMTLLFSSMAISQVIYSDQFDGPSQITGTVAGYSTVNANSNLRINGNGSAGAWAAIPYEINGSSGSANINISSSPKLFLRAKSTVGAILRVDLSDATGYFTNLNASYATLGTSYQILEIDFNGKFQDGGYGGPCAPASAPCNVNPNSIDQVLFFVNDSQGGFNGTIEIDWISFGESLDNTPMSSHDIRYNQVGYFTGRPKTISITSANSFTSIPYTITNSSGSTVMSGNAGPSVNWNSANQAVTQIDISSLNTPGDYTIATAETSATFKIDDQPYDILSEAALRYYYYNRASTAITTTHGGQWARPSGTPDTNVRVHSSASSFQRPTGTIISSPGGWYDAGDYNKYVVNSGISTYTVLAAYEHFPTFQAGKDVNIPESGDSMPDALDEAAYNIDWMLTMQDPIDGGVYHKMTALNFSGRIMPANYNLQRYVVQKTTAATLNFAGVMAQASRIYAAFPNEKPGYSATLLQAARDAYNWAKANSNVPYNQPNDVSTGAYGDGNFTDEFFWAATELFITTGQTRFLNDMNLNSVNGSVPAWPNVGSLGLYSLLENSSSVGSQVNMNTVAGKITTQANQIVSRINNSSMEVSMGSGDFVWGSNSSAANQIMLLLIAHKYTDNIQYLEAAYKGTDYLLGRNATGYCFVTGFGDQRVMNPHHRISDADGIVDPVPGMLAGGPHSGQQDGCNYDSNLPARSYVDDWCSYATNEVTINWNAPLFYLTSALEFYQEQELLSNEELTLEVETLKVFPNPSKEFIYYELSTDSPIDSLKVYNVRGQEVRNIKWEAEQNQIDVSQLSRGMYFLKLSAGDLHFTRKIIKD